MGGKEKDRVSTSSCPRGPRLSDSYVDIHKLRYGKKYFGLMLRISSKVQTKEIKLWPDSANHFQKKLPDLTQAGERAAEGDRLIGSRSAESFSSFLPCITTQESRIHGPLQSRCL